MALDALVARRLERLAGAGPDDPAFGLPRHIVEAMTVRVEPAPLYWADAIATLANVRPDAAPLHNVQAVTVALAYMDSAYSRYARDRAAYLGAHPELGPAAAAEAASLARARSLDADTLVPLFHYVVAKSMIDRPVLCAVLANTWLTQHGLADGRDGFALSMFKAACTWAAGAGGGSAAGGGQGGAADGEA
jgi:hypothetical protein